MRIERAQPKNAAALTSIAFAAKRHWGYPETWIESWREALTIEPADIASHETFMAILDGRLVGFYSTDGDGIQRELVHLWVLPDSMSKGIGRSLFTHGAERLSGLGCQRIKIASDPHAEGFYLRMGARRVGTHLTESDGLRRELPVLIYDLVPR